MMRHISHRTSQVRDLTFIRDPIYRKETKTIKGPTTGGGAALAGPSVNFGYETDSYAQQDAGVDLAYHVGSPEIVLPGLKMLQSPIVSRSGKLERTGSRITGACTFYAPSLDYIKALPNFTDTIAFAELESYDKLIDIERVIQNPADESSTSSTTHGIDLSPGSTYPAGYEIDRIQFKIKSDTDGLKSITLTGIDSTSKTIVWTNNSFVSDPFAPTDWTTVDLPLRDITTGDTQEVYIGGVNKSFTATADLDIDKLKGGVNTSYLSNLLITMSSNGSIELRDIYLYKEAEWRIESIKDYRDEYMQIAAVRVRGDRASRRRSYG
jgi:hypothetical protein